MNDYFGCLTRNGQHIETNALSDVLNDFFISVSGHILPLNDDVLNSLRVQLPDIQDNSMIVTELSVFSKVTAFFLLYLTF